MTQKQMRARLAGLYNSIEGASTYDIVLEIVELELELERESNK